MVVHRDVARVWDKIGGYKQLLELAETDFEAFMRIVCRLSPKLKADTVQDSDISEEELDEALASALDEALERRGEQPSVRRPKGKRKKAKKRAGRLKDPSPDPPNLESPSPAPDLETAIADPAAPIEYDDEGKAIQAAKEARRG